MNRKTTISCDRTTLEDIRSLKRGGQTYDELLSRMAEHYSLESGESE